MAAAKISKEHGPQDPNGTADPGQIDPRTRPKTPPPQSMDFYRFPMDLAGFLACGFALFDKFCMFRL